MSASNIGSSTELINAESLIRIYQAAFHRQPDKAGLDYWLSEMSKGVPLSKVAQDVTSSAEFKALYGSTVDRDGFIVQLYHNVLGRDPDVSGLQYWKNSNLSVSEMLVSFSQSSEFVQSSAAGVNEVLTNLAKGISPDINSGLNGVPVYESPMLTSANPADVAAVSLHQALHGVIHPDAESLANSVASFNTSLSKLGAYKELGVEEFNAGSNAFSGMSGSELVIAMFKAVTGHDPTDAQIVSYTNDLANEAKVFGASSAPGALLGKIVYDAEVAGDSALNSAVLQLLESDIVHFGQSIFDQGPDIVTEVVTEVVHHYVPTPTAEAHILTFDPNGTIDKAGLKPDGTMTFGSGNPPDHYATILDSTAGFQIGLRPIHRTSSEWVEPTNVVISGNNLSMDVYMDAGTQNGMHGESGIRLDRSDASLNFSIVTGPQGLVTDTVEFIMTLEGANHEFITLKLDTDANGVQGWFDSMGNNYIGDDAPSTNVAQNSMNFAFPSLGGVADVNPGVYHQELQAISLVGLSAGSVLADIDVYMHLSDPIIP